MLDFLSDSSYWDTLLSAQAKASLTEKLIIVAVIWATIGRRVSNRFKGTEEKFMGHLLRIETKFDNMVSEFKDLKDTFSRDLKLNSEALRVNSMRIERVENGQDLLNNRVERLEKQ
jgi:hypothetical protein